jgi:hypothetical protein
MWRITALRLSVRAVILFILLILPFPSCDLDQPGCVFQL